ncbi:hypothetical protein RclHR1_01020012 [Rhizophagus clarus]|uniref:Uncharacterized protein n=1 Tax=Rhizophagus clarus TaxID=94130 RepID=A0A2Z6QFC2_9GLOM|nr:hypothetical protein RclHR1_01020012 [Rhizophagus clarus]
MIEEKGTYPLTKQLCYTKKSNHPILHDYVIKTTYVRFGINLISEVQSSESLTDAVCKYYQEHKEESAAKISGPLLFGLKLSSVEKVRLSHRILNVVESEKENTFHKNDELKLKQVTFQTYNDMYNVNFGQFDKVEKKKKVKAVVKSLNKEHVFREAYRSLARIEQNIPREEDVYNSDNK